MAQNFFKYSMSKYLVQQLERGRSKAQPAQNMCKKAIFVTGGKGITLLHPSESPEILFQGKVAWMVSEHSFRTHCTASLIFEYIHALHSKQPG